jgi:predicted nucleotidyltransferase
LFGRPVDLVTARAITNPHFLKSIEDSRSTVYAG